MPQYVSSGVAAFTPTTVPSTDSFAVLRNVAVVVGAPLVVAVWVSSAVPNLVSARVSSTAFVVDTTAPLANGVVWDTSYSLVALLPPTTSVATTSAFANLQQLLYSVADLAPAVQHISQLDAAWPAGNRVLVVNGWHGGLFACAFHE